MWLPTQLRRECARGSMMTNKTVMITITQSVLARARIPDKHSNNENPEPQTRMMPEHKLLLQNNDNDD